MRIVSMWRRSKAAVVLVLWFGWAAAKDLESLWRHPSVSDYVVLASAGASWLFFAMAFLALALNLLAVRCIWRPIAKTPEVLLGALAAGALQALVTFAFVLANVPLAREAYALSRQARGLPARSDRLDTIFSAPVLWIGMLAVVVFYGVMAAVVGRSRRHLTSV